MGGNAHDIALHIDNAPVVRLHKGICNREGGGGGFFFFNSTQLIMIT